LITKAQLKAERKILQERLAPMIERLVEIDTELKA
jgi:hypothetical protein